MEPCAPTVTDAPIPRADHPPDRRIPLCAVPPTPDMPTPPPLFPERLRAPLHRETTAKGGIAAKRKQAGWNDGYLLRVLSN
ncbi:MAG: hypothetical protein OXC13_06345 [Caldilineaceae bacterium]|nr:hypothetical protein [Caldilineaceae bacterium]